MGLRLSALIVAVVTISVACSGPANPVSPSSFTATPAGLDRVVEGGGGGGAVCIPGPCPNDPRGAIRVDAGDADFEGRTDITDSDTDPLSFVATSQDLFLLAGHFSDGAATVDVANRTMSVSLSLVGPNGETFEITGEAEAVSAESRNSNCPSGRALTTESTLILRYLGRTVMTETHCIAP